MLTQSLVHALCFSLKQPVHFLKAFTSQNHWVMSYEMLILMQGQPGEKGPDGPQGFAGGPGAPGEVGLPGEAGSQGLPVGSCLLLPVTV